MSTIIGFCSFKKNYLDNESIWINILKSMSSTNDIDKNDMYRNKNIFILSKDKNSSKLFTVTVWEHTYSISFDGVIYNKSELKEILNSNGFVDIDKDEEIVLYLYILLGKSLTSYLNGSFAFCIWDDELESAFFCRDQVGLKPLFYTIIDDGIVFSSEIKRLFMYPDVKPIVDKKSIYELLGIGPAKVIGSGVFKGIHEIQPASFMLFDGNGMSEHKYYELKDTAHKEEYDDTVKTVYKMIEKSVIDQINCENSICSFLSGGVDSSVVSAIASNYYKKQGKRLKTFSFDYEDNDKHFISNDFQSDIDKPWALKMSNFLESDHEIITCKVADLADLIYESVDSHSLPCMADVDSSFLYFCKEVKKHCSSALSGECADEIFGGYPWYHNEDMINANAFPWSSDYESRLKLLDKNNINKKDIEKYANDVYESEVQKYIIELSGTKHERKLKEINRITYNYFMATLVHRMERTSRYANVNLYAPFSDYKLMEYVTNIPWSMKNKDGIAKNLLRESMIGIVPEEVLYRKKSPFPKTYNPKYTELIYDRFKDILSDNNSPILQFVDKNEALKFMDGEGNYTKPWFGQLMAGPQLIAYYLQINYWLKKFNVIVDL